MSAALFAVFYRDDAQGPVARYAGKRASREPFATYAEAEAIRQACPNGSQMETREVAA